MHMKMNKIISLLVLLSLLVFVTSSITVMPVSLAAQPADLGAWQFGPKTPNNFQYARHDGAFVPGPALATWANKVYFPGGRTSPGTESPNIWMFDPIAGTYTDTGADMIEDVSNYTANLVLDDGTGRGPAIYVIGGTDADHGEIAYSRVQRFYPKTNEVEVLPMQDNWTGRVAHYLIMCMGSAVVNDVIYVYGGWEDNVSPYFSSDTWSFDPKKPSGSRWTNISTPLHTPRSYIISAVQNGKIYAIGGVSGYDGNNLYDDTTVEVLDTTNISAGWTLLASLPVPGGEGRGYGFDVDTLNQNSPYQGKIYVVAPNQWPNVSSSVYSYNVFSDTWNTNMPELISGTADTAGTFIPLCTSNPNDGLPGIWTFGGRKNTECYPPDVQPQYSPLLCESTCNGLTGVQISGPMTLTIGEQGVYTATIMPPDASAPVSVLWSNGGTTPETTYSWDLPGTYTVEITTTNCDGSAVVTDTLAVEVYQPCTGLTGAGINGPTSLLVGETGLYTVSITPPDATLPFDILWSNGLTDTQATYSWNVPGLFPVSVTATNCGGIVAAPAFNVHVFQRNYSVWIPLIYRPNVK
jgi:hypothetical protein